MATQNPYPPPAPLVLASMLAVHALNPHVAEATRRLCGWAAETLPDLCRENNQLRHDRDQAEADAAHLFHLHYGPQQGGAA